MHTCIHIYIHIFIHTYIHHTYIQIYLHSDIHTHMHAYIHTYIHGNGMGMRIQSWEWEGMGLKKSFPHISNAYLILILTSELLCFYADIHINLTYLSLFLNSVFLIKQLNFGTSSHNTYCFRYLYSYFQTFTFTSPL